MTYNFYDFFAGGGMAGYGLGANWQCTFANDCDERKAASYRANHKGGDELKVCDVKDLTVFDLPGAADLAWASFPCQDLSLAGAGAGLEGKRSGTFWPFWNIIRELGSEGRAPRLVVLENVYGAITSHGGRDFAAIASSLSGQAYRFGALVIDAVHFVPQSRPRLFLLGVHRDLTVPPSLVARTPNALWHPTSLIESSSLLSRAAAEKWVWWNLPAPPTRNTRLSTFIEAEPIGVTWHSLGETEYILNLMTDRNLQKIETAKRAGKRMVGTIYRRTRRDSNGEKRQRAEVRFDEISGCLRTPVGGSSRQTIVVVERENVRSRLLSPREAARLMGLPDEYVLPKRYNDAYHLAGDGVVVQVVAHLARHLLEPLLGTSTVRVAA